MPYFVGNVLPSSDAPGENDNTFDFTKEESIGMSLDNVPIRLEHEEGLAVGHVKRDWTDSDGKKWILGEVKEDTLEGRFASNAIQPSSMGHTLYPGLSLQHVHTSFRDGSTSKRAIEVSLCAEPRRPGCHVASVQSTKKMDYITHIASRQNMSTEQINTPAQESTPEVTQAPVVESAPAAPSVPQEPAAAANQEELMKLVIDQESELSGTKSALETAQAELQKLQAQWKEREDNERLHTKSKAEALSKALVDSWSASLPADMMTDENKQAIFALAQNFPEQSVKMMEIAHKASKKYATDIKSMEQVQAAKQKRQLESRVMDIVTKKRRVAPTEPDTRSVVHAASTKTVNPFSFDAHKTSSSMNSIRDRNPDLFKALSGFSTGNLRDRMGQIANINGN
tara:strand:- start:505 stop:1695 length:1191 start_codon:yes stop_codon:yes gene_type:complete